MYSFAIYVFPEDVNSEKHLSTYLSVLLPTKFVKYNVTLFFIVRAWLYYFDVNHSKELQNYEWKILLDEHYESMKYNWFVVHRRDWGNTTVLLLSATIISIVITLLYGVLYRRYPLYSDPAHIFVDIYSVSMFLVCFFVGVLWWRRFPKFDDMLGIRIELKRVMWIWGSGLLSSYIVILSTTLMAGSEMNGEFVMTLQRFPFALPFMALFVSVTLYISTVDIHRRHVNDNDDAWNRMTHYVAASVEDTARTQGMTVLDSSPKSVVTQITSWKPFVRGIRGYELFMGHLQHEFGAMLLVLSCSCFVSH